MTRRAKGALRDGKEPSVYGTENYEFHKCTGKPLEDFEKVPGIVLFALLKDHSFYGA